MDVHGTVGTLCTCGVPMRGGFVPMYSAVNFGYYLYLLDAAKKERDLQVFIMDNNCHSKKHLIKQ